MEINSDVRVAAVNTARTEGASESAGTARPARMAEGTVITGEISDLKTDSVTIVTADGAVTAGLRDGPIEAKIGDTASFTLRYDASGEAVAELKQLPRNMLQKANVSDALTAAGFKASPENIKMALELFNNGLSLTKENLLHMNQALKLMGADKITEALFMLENNLKIGPRTANTLEKLLAGEAKLLEQLGSLEKSISGIKQPALKEQLIKLFQNEDPAGSLLKEITAGLNDPANDISKTAGKIMQAMGELAPDDLQKLNDGLKQILDSPQNPDRSGLNEVLGKELAKALSDQPELASKLDSAIAFDDDSNMQSRLNTETAPEKTGTNNIKENAAPEKSALEAADRRIAQNAADGLADKAIEINESKTAVQAEALNKYVKEALSEIINAKNEFFTLADRNEGGFVQLKELIDSGKMSLDDTENILKFLKISKNPEDISPNELGYLKEKLTEDGKAPQNKLMSKLKFDPRNSSPADVDKFLTELRDSLTTARNELIKHPSPESANLMKDIADINSNIELTSQLKNNLFIQLPLAINNHETNLELFVFKDGKKKKKALASTALVALDTANLGRVETYIQKDGSSINLQFRVKSSEVESRILQNLDKLNTQLKAHNLNLSAYSFKLLTEDFTLVKGQDILTDQPDKEEHNKDEKMVIFDVRL